MIYGYTGDYFNGHPIFIREEYEKYHFNMSILDRIGEITNKTYDSELIAISDLYNKNLHYLLYRQYNEDLDNKLRRGECNFVNLWHKYKNGYVHEVTGEYIECFSRPNRDSWPIWSKGPGGVYDNFLSDIICDLGLIVLGMLSLFKG